VQEVYLQKSHAAQLYILPEAIVISMILLRDEKSFCMKPDLQVNLFVDAVEGSMMQKGGTCYLALRKIFRQSCGFLQEPPCGMIIMSS
jgi:chromatin licensing and DNA replication factor 1